ncbi:MAG TPA: electron transfer flavoprotein subunit beta/FixA family protein [Candidatus Limnocylindrales bacterium]|nr:electron transfer flavoprotein subunit beta/FixA family protein [Candidatus Limnocylindrales bacterium]
MRIVVLVRHVPCATGGLFFNPDNTLRRGGVRSQLNEADAGAVEHAWRIAVRRTGSQVTAVTMGPAEAAAAVRRSLVLGADEGVHIQDDALAGCDALGTARVLAAAARQLGFDLVLCGVAATGSATALVPAMVAEILGVPVLCSADSLTLDHGTAVIRRVDRTRVETLSATLPAVVSVTPRCGVGRYPRFAAVTQARHKLVRTWPLSRLDVPRHEVAPATLVRAVRPVSDRGRVVVDCDPPAAAARLADFLARRELL